MPTKVKDAKWIRNQRQYQTLVRERVVTPVGNATTAERKAQRSKIRAMMFARKIALKKA